MTHDPHATALLASIKASKKHLEDRENVFYTKFIREHQKPTAHDVAEMEKLVHDFETAAHLMQGDIQEIRHESDSLGGPSDTMIRNIHTLRDTIKKAAAAH